MNGIIRGPHPVLGAVWLASVQVLTAKGPGLWPLLGRDGSQVPRCHQQALPNPGAQELTPPSPDCPEKVLARQ